MIVSACPGGCDVSVTTTVVVTDPAAKIAATPSETVTGAGTVAAGASSLSFFNYGPATVTINGEVLAVRASISFPFLGANVTYPAMSYDATGSTIRIDRTIL
ncbi:MAG TPA: hypothetical protein PKW18_12975 [Candidatus Sumerlaeota bacterium]|nr:hypothetical protein [Candidatus Sumerlaeota bacterium]